MRRSVGVSFRLPLAVVGSDCSAWGDAFATVTSCSSSAESTTSVGPVSGGDLLADRRGSPGAVDLNSARAPGVSRHGSARGGEVVDVAVDGRSGDAEFLGDLLHGVLTGFVHLLGDARLARGQFRFLPTGAAGARAAVRPSMVRSDIRACAFIGAVRPDDHACWADRSAGQADPSVPERRTIGVRISGWRGGRHRVRGQD